MRQPTSSALYPDTAFLIAYSRISDDWRKHNRKKAATSSWAAGKGVVNQHRRNDKNAARHDAVLVHRYTDNDLSPSKRGIRRPEFQAMLRDVRRGQTAEGYPDTASAAPTRTACRARTETGQSALHLTDGVVGALSTLTPLALAGSVHLYILMASTAERRSGTGRTRVPGRSAVAPRCRTARHRNWIVVR
ncbi:recombinase family protein [Streptomyces griseus]|uniref:hypothetical protein n=1 Tax=Streptomyces griseus TaxID=1911 RepID=UPI00364D3C47